MTYTYDQWNCLTGITTPTTTYGFTHDDYGNMLSVSMNGQTLATYTYALHNGKLSSMTYGNGTTVYYTYDALDNVSKIRYNDDTGA